MHGIYGLVYPLREKLKKDKKKNKKNGLGGWVSTNFLLLLLLKISLLVAGVTLERGVGGIYGLVYPLRKRLKREKKNNQKSSFGWVGINQFVFVFLSS